MYLLQVNAVQFIYTQVLYNNKVGMYFQDFFVMWLKQSLVSPVKLAYRSLGLVLRIDRPRI